MMKKYLMTGIAAVALGGLFVGCNNYDDLSGGNSAEFNILKNYEEAFITRFGQPAANQTWGFGDPAASTRALTRSQAAPACPDIVKPYDEAWVTTYCQTAKEPNSTNVGDNYDNSVYNEAVPSVWVKTADAIPGTPGYYEKGWWNWDEINKYRYTGSGTEYTWIQTYLEYWLNNGWQITDEVWAGIVTQAETDGYTKFLYYKEGSEGTPEQGYWTEAKDAYWTYDETYVTNFKITGTWNGGISVVASEGYLPDHVTRSNAERTVVVTGVWNITEDQRVGEFGKIIIADGGTVNVAEGKTLSMVNQARLVVLPGGQLTGAGSVEVNNGNAEGLENYNGGTIDVAVFNNNFGKFYNYGDFLVTEYQGGAQESNFYNHHLASIHHFAGTGSTANARIFNACQFYVQTNARIRNYEGIGGSALIVGGQLMFSSSEDGTSTPTYVGLASGALIKCNTLYNNGTSWTGPTSGYAALEIVSQIDYLNWQQDAPATGGYFENNIYVKNGTWTNVPDGNGYHQTNPSDEANYKLSIADYKFWKIVANCRGNNGVKKVKAGNTQLLPADEDFVLGISGCTPGFTGDEDGGGDTPTGFICRVIAEDLTVNESTDFDFNDVVFDVFANGVIRIRACGGTLPLKVDGQEVHGLFGEETGTMINTGWNGAIRDDIYEEIQYSGGTIADVAAANDILVEVQKGDQWIPLVAPVGQVASKIAVGEDYPWCSERQDIDTKWHLKDGTKTFSDYVRGNIPSNEWYRMVIEEAAKYQNKKNQ